MGITGVKDDEKINMLIPSISQLVRNYCDNPIIDYYSTPFVEYFDVQWDTYTAQLKYSPIVNISSVYERETQSSDYVLLVANSDYWFDVVSDSVFRTTSDGRYRNYPKGTGAVKVTYTCLKDERKERRSLGAATISYAKNSDDGSFPDYIKRVLDIYKI